VTALLAGSILQIEPHQYMTVLVEKFVVRRSGRS